MNHALFNTRLQVVVNQLGSYSWNWLFASRIDIAEYHFVKKTQTIGKVLVEVTGARLEGWLEDSRNLAIFEKLTNTLGALVNLLWVMSVV